MRKLAYLLTVLAWVGLTALPAAADSKTYNFYGLSGNAANFALGEQYLTFTVSDEGSGKVKFTFNNNAPAGPPKDYKFQITEIYFYGEVLKGSTLTVTNGPGVNFDTIYPPGSVNPADVPGGGGPAYNLNKPTFAADTEEGANNGIGPGEYAEFLFASPGYTNVIAALDKATFPWDKADELFVGIHVRSFPDGGSASFTNVVPLPSTLLLLGSGLVGLVGLARRRRD